MRNRSQILVIDDDTELCDLLADYLGAEGFSVEAVHRGDQGLARASSGDHDLILLDVMLPGQNGFDVLRRIREVSQVPVVMLTARGEDVDRIVGLEIGADDYLPKPFNPRELVARIRAIKRRVEREAGERSHEEGLVRVGDVEIRLATHTVLCQGRDIALTNAEFDLLALLLRSAGRIVSREEISETVLQRRFFPTDRAIDVHISSLRKKLGRLPGGGDRIRSVRSVGYLYVVG
ncbi:MAG: response regulator transcription factor [Bradymonadales bacterium]|nr:response regulator transcription factor [Bradymonadales bacterium]